jgi:hypothetical protein
MITILNVIYYNSKRCIGMSKATIMATIVLVLFTVMLTVAALVYPYDLANARKLRGAIHISTSHTTNCDGDVCEMVVCVNGKCHGSKPSQGSNSTSP